jgi:hypothetical protein
MILNWNVVLGCGLEKCRPEYGLEVGFYECDIETVGSIEDVIFGLTDRRSASQAGFRFTELLAAPMKVLVEEYTNPGRDFARVAEFCTVVPVVGP